MCGYVSLWCAERQQCIQTQLETQINDLLLKIYSGELSLDQGLEDMQKLVDEAKAP